MYPDLRAKCETYALYIFKPMLEHIAKVNNETEIKNMKIAEMKNKIFSYELELEKKEKQLAKIKD